MQRLFFWSPEKCLRHCFPIRWALIAALNRVNHDYWQWWRIVVIQYCTSTHSNISVLIIFSPQYLRPATVTFHSAIHFVSLCPRPRILLLRQRARSREQQQAARQAASLDDIKQKTSFKENLNWYSNILSRITSKQYRAAQAAHSKHEQPEKLFIPTFIIIALTSLLLISWARLPSSHADRTLILPILPLPIPSSTRIHDFTYPCRIPVSPFDAIHLLSLHQRHRLLLSLSPLHSRYHTSQPREHWHHRQKELDHAIDALTHTLLTTLLNTLVPQSPSWYSLSLSIKVVVAWSASSLHILNKPDLKRRTYTRITFKFVECHQTSSIISQLARRKFFFESQG